MRLTSGS